MTATTAIKLSIEDAKAMKAELLRQSVNWMKASDSITRGSIEARTHHAKWLAMQDSIDELDASITDMQDELSELTETH